MGMTNLEQLQVELVKLNEEWKELDKKMTAYNVKWQAAYNKQNKIGWKLKTCEDKIWEAIYGKGFADLYPIKGYITRCKKIKEKENE